MGKIFLSLEKTNEPNKKRVSGYMYMPEMLSEEELKQGILVDEVPLAENIPGKRAELFYNTATQTLFYEYFDEVLPPTSPEQLIKDLQKELNTVKAENKDLKLAIAESAEAQQQADTENKMAIAELAELIATKEGL
ncbi:hypothetical protein [Lysinibacillus xylanilyticus]|uniref:hypothetical protein n=1 Tax=Lysinibacillus xylanilyticus TaxID=582475 RepID=UPI003CFDA6A5